MHVVREAIGAPINLYGLIIIFLAIELVALTIYAIVYVILFKIVYPRKLRKRNIYRTFHNYKKDEEEAERMKEIREENSRIMQREEKQKIEQFTNLVTQKYGLPIAIMECPKIIKGHLALYSDYLIYVEKYEVKNEYNLNGYSDCDLVYDKFSGAIFIELIYPTTQSRVDKFINGKNCDSFLITSNKKISQEKKNEINQFFLLLKNRINSNLY